MDFRIFILFILNFIIYPFAHFLLSLHFIPALQTQFAFYTWPAHPVCILYLVCTPSLHFIPGLHTQSALYTCSAHPVCPLYLLYKPSLHFIPGLHTRSAFYTRSAFCSLQFALYTDCLHKRLVICLFLEKHFVGLVCLNVKG